MMKSKGIKVLQRVSGEAFTQKRCLGRVLLQVREEARGSWRRKHSRWYKHRCMIPEVALCLVYARDSEEAVLLEQNSRRGGQRDKAEKAGVWDMGGHRRTSMFILNEMRSRGVI